MKVAHDKKSTMCNQNTSYNAIMTIRNFLAQLSVIMHTKLTTNYSYVILF